MATTVETEEVERYRNSLEIAISLPLLEKVNRTKFIDDLCQTYRALALSKFYLDEAIRTRHEGGIWTYLQEENAQSEIYVNEDQQERQILQSLTRIKNQLLLLDQRVPSMARHYAKLNTT